MAFCTRSFFAALVCMGAAVVTAQQTKSPPDSAAIVQPGAPGRPSKSLSATSLNTAPKEPFGPDVAFMQGMIMHHSQAVDMVALLRKRGKSPALKELGERITISQSDEIRSMKQWLESRGKPTTMEMDHSHMNMADMKSMDTLMPGMLTPQQMDALAKAKGAEFDHLFLTGMIQHHTGALTMVDELFDTPGAGQEPSLFDFATDIDNTQRAEIKIMRGMLDKETR